MRKMPGNFIARATMIEALGVAAREGEPVLNYAEKLDVEIWPIHRV